MRRARPIGRFKAIFDVDGSDGPNPIGFHAKGNGLSLFVKP
jgi:hypothetical protein